MASIKMKNAPAELKHPGDPFVISVQAGHYFRQTRYYWIICQAGKPEELVSWGHARSEQEAEAAARDEVESLLSGSSLGGKSAPAFRRVGYTSIHIRRP